MATQLDPLDAILYTSLVWEVGESIEGRRIPASDHVVFSHRFAPDNAGLRFFDQQWNFGKFQSHSEELAKRHPVVVVTDIADFFPRIYLHRLEGALTTVLGSSPAHAKAILHMIKSWNQNVSYGLPVGSNPSRLLAELVIDDIDRSLLSDGVTFCRFVDDYRIFCDSPQEAHERLAGLANLLLQTHGLTLNHQKTDVIDSEEFIRTRIQTEGRRELSALADGFEDLVSQLDLDSPYEDIDYDDLPEEVQGEIDGLNLEGLLDEQLERDDVDISMCKFLLNRLGQLNRTDPLTDVLSETEKLYPVFAEIIRYVGRVRESLSPGERRCVGKRLMGLLQGSIVSHLEFHRALTLMVFADSGDWGCRDMIAPLYDTYGDQWSRRSAVLALGRYGQDFWFRARKQSFDQLPPWERRAFIRGASCLPPDERRHWVRAIRPRLDDLEKCVVQWATAGP